LDGALQGGGLGLGGLSPLPQPGFEVSQVLKALQLPGDDEGCVQRVEALLIGVVVMQELGMKD
jgi:hypothetical protein